MDAFRGQLFPIQAENGRAHGEEGKGDGNRVGKELNLYSWLNERTQDSVAVARFISQLPLFLLWCSDLARPGLSPKFKESPPQPNQCLPFCCTTASFSPWLLHRDTLSSHIYCSGLQQVEQKDAPANVTARSIPLQKNEAAKLQNTKCRSQGGRLFPYPDPIHRPGFGAPWSRSWKDSGWCRLSSVIKCVALKLGIQASNLGKLLPTPHLAKIPPMLLSHSEGSKGFMSPHVRAHCNSPMMDLLPYRTI